MRFGCITGSGTSERIDVRAWWIDVRDDPPQLDMQPSCITAAAPAPRRRIRINGARESNGRRAAPWPAPDTARPLDVPTRERPVAAKQFDIRLWCAMRSLCAIRLFFSCSSVVAFGGPSSGNCCRLRRRPASRRRIDAPPVDGLDVRRSVFVLMTR